VYLVGIIVEVYYDGRTYERQRVVCNIRNIALHILHVLSYTGDDNVDVVVVVVMIT
jgi:hypothetical protein